MKPRFPLIAVFVAMLSLTACGGAGTSASGIAVSSPAALTKTDTVVGTGLEAVSGKTVTINYTGWLYSDTAADHKGAKFETGSFAFTVGAIPNQAILGMDQGVVGMKVGGKRTVLIPASLAYGATGSGPIPPNSGLAFDVELTKVQ
jgi:FKBP-type peptidyl-prolyl cis-trans isomerase FkpA